MTIKEMVVKRMGYTARMASLKRQHKELEEEIRYCQSEISFDSLDVLTLKRKKLAIKEQLEALGRKLRNL
jgi:hypothetical protein